MNRNEVAVGIINSDKNVIMPILLWLLKNIQGKKERVYLSRFLVPIEVPYEFLSTDDQVREAYER